ncbi:MAG: EAL domain-containing protein [Burkholderiales bacterium]
MSRQTVRVLLTEDSRPDAELELRELKRAGLAVTHRIVDAEPEFVAALKEFVPHVILSDFSMPGFDGMAALALAREHAPETPFIFVSGTIGEEYAIRALRNGATDYVLKSNLVRLPAAVERAIADSAQRRRLARLSRIRDLLGALSSELMRARDRDLVYDAFCRIAVSRGGFVLARIVESDAEGRVRVAATTEADTALFQSMVDEYNQDPAGAVSLLATALRSRQPIVSNDLAADPRVPNREALAREGNYALALLPIAVEGRTAAVAVLRGREPGFFDQEELVLLSEMVSNMAFALELVAKQDQIAYLALHDALTGLPNRTLFHERLAQGIENARRAEGQTLALALIDLERFKAINDTLGRQAGDEVLKAVARRLSEAAGDVHRVARLGSNLYGLIFHDARGAEEVGRRLEAKAVQSFGVPFEIGGQEVRLAAKTGIALFPDDGADAEALVRNAEAALKRAKETGERYVFYAPAINARVAEQVELEHLLRGAVENGELFFHFQPKFDLMTRRVSGVEILARWNGPDGNPVSPAKFVPVLEETGLILEATRQAIAAASAAYRGWRARSKAAPRVAVNISAIVLRRRSFVEDVREALGGALEDGGGVDLEITESLLMTEVDDSIRKLRALREMGMHVALDDFGTGYSSLAYLSRLPLDTLKIDRAFVKGMTESPDDTSIVSTIITLAQALKLSVVAEGVETEQQAQLLRLLRCDEAQGFLFSRPVPAEGIDTLL